MIYPREYFALLSIVRNVAGPDAAAQAARQICAPLAALPPGAPTERITQALAAVCTVLLPIMLQAEIAIKAGDLARLEEVKRDAEQMIVALNKRGAA